MTNHFYFLSKKLYPKRKSLACRFSSPAPTLDRILSKVLAQEQIEYGNQTEKALSEIFSSIPGVNVLKSEVTFNKYGRKKNAVIDHVVDIGSKIIVIEQKLRDNHDSTKNTGQFDDLIDKTNAIKNLYPDREVIPVMYFLIDIEKPAKKRFTSLLANYGGKVCYGKELFDTFFPEVSNDAWANLENHILKFQRDERLKIDYDDDNVINDVIREIRKSKRDTNRIVKILNDPIMNSTILPSISKNGKFKQKVLLHINGPSLFE